MNKTLTTRILAFIGAATVALTLSACDSDEINRILEEASEPSSSSAPAADVQQDEDYFTVTGTAVREYDATAGEVDYCDADSLGRATCAYGELTADTRTEAQARGRQPLNVDPAGWPSDNEKVHIPALDGVEDSKDYNGWMWNRSHLLGDSIGGDPIEENLVAGTRPQNVGSAKNSGGMAYTETIARDYLDSSSANECPLYYAATPNYEGDEMIPRTVTVDIQSCDKSIDERVEVANTANGFTIDYTDGAYTEG